MTTATEMLRMIETVSPDDTAKLDEIDARVYLEYTELGQSLVKFHDKDISLALKHAIHFEHAEKYTRSRDALKAIRPNGWQLEVQEGFSVNGWRAGLMKRSDKLELVTAYLPTEELSELHAIIQAIEYDRSNGGAQ